MATERWQELAEYNSRVSKGIVHTKEYVIKMAEEQRLFDAWQMADKYLDFYAEPKKWWQHGSLGKTNLTRTYVVDAPKVHDQNRHQHRLNAMSPAALVCMVATTQVYTLIARHIKIIQMIDDLIVTLGPRYVQVEYEPLPDDMYLDLAQPYAWLDTSGPIESIQSWIVVIKGPNIDFPARGFGTTPQEATESAHSYALLLADPEYRESVRDWRPETLATPTPPIKPVDPTSSAEAKRRLRKSKEAERTVGRWLLEHDGSDPRMKGIASSTGRTGHVTGMQIDVMSITYACEVKNIRVWASLWKFWNKIVDRAVEHGKEPLLVIIPTNVPLGLKKFVPAMHIMTETRHAGLLAAEKELHEMKSQLAKETE